MLNYVKAPSTTKDFLTSAHHSDVLKQFQEGIDEQLKSNTDNTPQACGFSKLSNNSCRLHFKTEDDAKFAKSTNWAAILPGVQEHQKLYGIVAHMIPRKDFDPNDISQKTIDENKTKLEDDNPELPIAHVRPLRKRNSSTYHSSIVIFTNNAEAADACIDQGIYFNGTYYPNPERYIPQLNMVQCYKCHGFKHTAAQCRAKNIKCGHCANEEHKSDSCPEKETSKCHKCDGPHKAWDSNCPLKIAERKRIDELRESTSAFFTK